MERPTFACSRRCCCFDRAVNEFTRIKKAKLLLVLLFLLAANASPAPARIIRIRLLNAKSGKPMGGENITVRWDTGEASIVALDGAGAGSAAIPKGAQQFVLATGPERSSEPGRVAYLDCNERDSAFVSASEIVRRGMVMKNKCGDRKELPRAGEIVFWAVPKPFWDFQ